MEKGPKEAIGITKMVERWDIWICPPAEPTNGNDIACKRVEHNDSLGYTYIYT